MTSLLPRPASAFRHASLLPMIGIIGIIATGPALAQNAASPRTISVSGQGEAKAAPDMAQVTAGVSSQAVTAAAALGANNQAMTRVMAVLKRAGIEDRAIQTSNFSVSPQYPPYNPANPNEGQRRIIGYQVSNQVTVRIDDIARTGNVLDALVSAGANNINGVDFGIKEQSALMETARKNAVADALARARTFAAAAGVTLGDVLSINENGGSVMPAPRMMMMAAKADSVPVATGEETVSAGVSITFSIR